MKGTFIAARLLAVTLLLAAGHARADVAAEWNGIARQAAIIAGLDPSATRALEARVREAIAKARHVGNGGDDGYPVNGGNGHEVGRSGSDSQRSDAAMSVAAFVVLERLLPAQREDLEARLALTFSRIPETDAKAEGAAMGRKLARELRE